MTHVWTPELKAEFERVLHAGGGSTDVWLLLDPRTAEAPTLGQRYSRCHVFGEGKVMGRAHRPALDFFLSNRNYDWYWIIEYDVRLSGSWKSLFGAFEPFHHDLVTSHIRRYADEPRWIRWDSLQHPVETIPRAQYLRSFNVVYRISNRALWLLCQALLDGWTGHPEVLVPTLTHRAGMTLLDIGGNGEFALSQHRNRHYTSQNLSSGTLGVLGTVRHRPARVRAGRRKGAIYHPVKPRPMVEPPALRGWLFVRWALEAFRDLLERSSRRARSHVARPTADPS